MNPMETFSIILEITGILLILASLVLCCACHPMGIVGSALGFAIYGFAGVVYMSHEDKLELAAGILKEDGDMLITRYHRDTVGAIYAAALDVKNNRKKLQSISQDLENKATKVADEGARSIFRRKQQNLAQLSDKLGYCLVRLERCAFEQILYNYTEELSGATGQSQGSISISDELDSVRQVMQEVEQIQSL